MITSSNTTDETIVADSDVETDTAISDHTVAASKSQHHMSEDKAESKVTSSANAVNLGEAKVNINIQNDPEKEEISEPMEEDVQVIEKTAVSGFKAGGEDVQVINKVVQDEACDAVFVNKAPKDENLDSSREETCHVIFSQDLIVKRVLQPAPAVSTETGGVNFKRFKKVYLVCSCCLF